MDIISSGASHNHGVGTRCLIKIQFNSGQRRVLALNLRQIPYLGLSRPLDPWLLSWSPQLCLSGTCSVLGIFWHLIESVNMLFWHFRYQSPSWKLLLCCRKGSVLASGGREAVPRCGGEDRYRVLLCPHIFLLGTCLQSVFSRVQPCWLLHGTQCIRWRGPMPLPSTSEPASTETLFHMSLKMSNLVLDFLIYLKHESVVWWQIYGSLLFPKLLLQYMLAQLISVSPLYDWELCQLSLSLSILLDLWQSGSCQHIWCLFSCWWKK